MNLMWTRSDQGEERARDTIENDLRAFALPIAPLSNMEH